MNQKLSASAQRVQDALRQRGYAAEVIELPQSTRTAIEAAQAVGCDVAQIVKSLIFKTKRTERPVLVIASGANRVNEKALETLIGEPLGKADAEFVRQQTGFVIGGVPPIGHIQPIQTFIDEDLLRLNEIWAAAGTPHAVFKMSPQMLVEMCGGQVVKIT